MLNLRNARIAPLFLFFSALMWSTSGIFTKSVAWNGLCLAVLRGLIAFLASAWLLRGRRIKLNPQKLLMGFCYFVQGTLFMEALASPFESVERILQRENGKYDLALCDFHGEATSEKKAFGYYFDSRIGAIFGTHTHVPTADLTILPGGTGYLTDLGMVGGADSVLGMKKEIAIEKFLTRMPTYYQVAEGESEAWGAIFDLSPDTGKCLSCRQIHLTEE